MQNSAENVHYLDAGHCSHLSPRRRNYFLGIIISLLMLLGPVGPLHFAHASTTNGTLTGSLNVAHAAHTVPLLPYGQVLASMEQYIPGTTPVLYLPSTITVDATGPLGAIVTYTVSASDPDNPASLPTVNYTPPSGSIFPIGTTTVLCTASDAFGNTTSGSFLVIILDVTAPTLYLPGTITTDATSAQGAVVTYIINASDPDNQAYQLTIDCTPPSGSTFPIGTTPVLCTARDPAGNTTSGSFQVTVLNRTAPVLYLPGTITVDATDQLGAIVTYTVSASDPDNPASLPTVNCTPPSGSIFPIGTTTVLCTANDLAGNTANGNFNVVVEGAAAQLSDLLTLVKSFSSSAKLQALVTRLQDTLTAVDAGQTATACSALTQFIGLVRVQSRSGLTMSQVNQLLTAATRIQAVLACH